MERVAGYSESERDRPRQQEQQQERILQRGTGLSFIAGIAVGSAVMYFLDPRSGAGRRSFARDRLASRSSRSVDTAGKRLRHVRNQLQGIISSSAGWFRPVGAPSDSRLAGRIRSQLGRVTPHVHAVAVEVCEGAATLSGRISEGEIAKVIAAARQVPGIREVVDALTRIDTETKGAAPRQEEQHM